MFSDGLYSHIFLTEFTEPSWNDFRASHCSLLQHLRLNMGWKLTPWRRHLQVTEHFAADSIPACPRSSRLHHNVFRGGFQRRLLPPTPSFLLYAGRNFRLRSLLLSFFNSDSESPHWLRAL
jgi:hypothetical protein